MNLVEENKTYATEGSRWYTKDGQSVEDVIGKNGNPRKATLRDARKEGWTPSVTSILQIMAKPELENWKMKEVAKFCADAHFIGDGENLPEWAAWAVDQAKEQMSKARDTGSDVHGAVDHFLEYNSAPESVPPYIPAKEGYALYVQAAVKALDEMGVLGKRMKIETPFCRNGVAGKIDLMGEQWICDWKTTSKPLDDGKVPDWSDYLCQLSAYSMGYFGTFVPCRNVFLSTSVPGNYAIREWSVSELHWGWELFKAARHLWQIKNEYYFCKDLLNP